MGGLLRKLAHPAGKGDLLEHCEEMRRWSRLLLVARHVEHDNVRKRSLWLSRRFGLGRRLGLGLDFDRALDSCNQVRIDIAVRLLLIGRRDRLFRACLARCLARRLASCLASCLARRLARRHVCCLARRSKSVLEQQRRVEWLAFLVFLHGQRAKCHHRVLVEQGKGHLLHARRVLDDARVASPHA